jgi:hypothetical protein
MAASGEDFMNGIRIWAAIPLLARCALMGLALSVVGSTLAVIPLLVVTGGAT